MDIHEIMRFITYQSMVCDYLCQEKQELTHQEYYITLSVEGLNVLRSLGTTLTGIIFWIGLVESLLISDKLFCQKNGTFLPKTILLRSMTTS